jgi:hypothetical protein
MEGSVLSFLSKSNRSFLVSGQRVKIPYAKSKIIFVDCPFPALSIDQVLFNSYAYPLMYFINFLMK